ncbi:MAG: YbaB/EbfC family nucleoid-associated protein [Treponema sp.]|jgi:DNA-binding YbaB/EbfC family protein|nr:YbaB/EbfC family nucleoid-associated protein [Treponema sp.]
MTINPLDILKNAQKIQEQMSSFQERLAEFSETGSAGGGMVEVEINGKMEVLAVRISPEAVDPNDVQMLEDITAAAVGSALEKISGRIKNEMGLLAGGAGIIPGLFG